MTVVDDEVLKLITYMDTTNGASEDSNCIIFAAAVPSASSTSLPALASFFSPYLPVLVSLCLLLYYHFTHHVLFLCPAVHILTQAFLPFFKRHASTSLSLHPPQLFRP